MDMSSSSNSTTTSTAAACKISMLWNWYTVDTCFIAKSWHVRSKGGFAGSCIGVFFLVLALQWLHRFCRELDIAIAEKHRAVQQVRLSKSTSSDEEIAAISKISRNSSANPYISTLGHSWLFTSSLTSDIIPTFPEQLLRSVLYTVEWGVSYIIMLLFMYYNGYIIISCILGAFMGKLLFTMNEPLSCNDEEDRKCCK